MSALCSPLFIVVSFGLNNTHKHKDIEHIIDVLVCLFVVFLKAAKCFGEARAGPHPGPSGGLSNTFAP